ncbi:LamG-like jellyroll fold domain-containing protein [Streptantibioticus ferralitis]|uniref:Metallophosphoesterase n=1 Tax=Streptantibioticus ferralitis TaxID=236510 RepID=A0ABT5Z707_9ACTN|nr:LamG-like jellyroll fold domain-containing protein [Streptantibioticus ferralitis]MDF2258810.1 metallophosphoesterase [Streptantibioticus ferralitis]
MCNAEHQPDGPQLGTIRRSFLRNTGLVSLGAAVASIAGGATASAAPLPTTRTQSAQSAGARPDPTNPRFTLVVMPDTQYMFDGESIHPEPIKASFRYILDHTRDENIVFMSHLGDLTQNGQQPEFDAISEAFTLLDNGPIGYSVLAGNHDINSSTGDQRGTSPYLGAFGPQRFRHAPTFGGASPDGYNTYHVFQAAGREWLVLALDWRLSPAGFAWARDVIKQHPKTPVILTTHEIVYADNPGDPAQLSDYGKQLWDGLIASNDQIFLTLNGHFWPPARTTLKNNAGNEVHLHITNYQNRYYGGAAMIRLYHFDLARNTIDVQTFSPWILDRSEERLNELERQEIELTSDQDYFSIPIDFTQRFSGFAPVPPRPARPAQQMLIPGTVAYWRFDGTGRQGPLPDTVRISDLSGNGNDLTKVSVPGSPANALSWSTEFHPDQPGHGSIFFTGHQNPLQGAYLQTGPNAPLNKAMFSSGYTVEAFFKLPADWNPDNDAWAALLSRWGMSSESKKTSGDPQEPIATLSLSGGAELQWCIYPLNLTGSVTNWGHYLPLNAWWHVAVVNDGHHTTMYVDGCPVVRNPSTESTGITTLGRPWMLGGYEYGGTINQILHGYLGDVRIVNRALPTSKFMRS